MAKWLCSDVVTMPLKYMLCTSEKQYRKQCRKIGIKDADIVPFSDGCFGAKCNWYDNDGQPVVFVCMSEPPPDLMPCQIYALLVHEAVHVKQFFMQGIGEDSPSAEFEAYTVQRIAQSLFYEWDQRHGR